MHEPLFQNTSRSYNGPIAATRDYPDPISGEAHLEDKADAWCGQRLVRRLHSQVDTWTARTSSGSLPACPKISMQQSGRYIHVCICLCMYLYGL